MSELADQERLVKRGWAAPGGSHDRVVQAMKIGLPALIGVVLAFLAFAPFEDKQEVSFLLDKNKVDQADDRMQVQAAQYRGVDDQGRAFLIDARHALQRTATDPVQISGMQARMDLESGPAELRADRARYDVAGDKVDVLGPILLTAADGYRMETRDVTVDLRTRRLASDGAVEGRMPLGTFSGGRLEADLGERRVVLTGRPRLHIVQGAMR
ncbi:MAG: LPS export ABC transporter periplasmic protein LptC [Sphingomonas sp.]|nr:LPS export ABC transporter periplasmic protein LptC [Sphingomonas sp.]